jgi:hypothetical protein
VLSVFLAHFAGFYIYFFVQLKQVREEMRAQLKQMPADKLELIKLSISDFEKAKVEEHEIKVSGKMYDISRIEKVGDTLFVYCLHDEAEDNLLAFLDKILTVPLKDKSAPSQVLKFTSLTFILPASPNVQPVLSIQSLPATLYKVGTSTFVLSLDSPPPKV